MNFLNDEKNYILSSTTLFYSYLFTIITYTTITIRTIAYTIKYNIYRVIPFVRLNKYPIEHKCIVRHA